MTRAILSPFALLALAACTASDTPAPSTSSGPRGASTSSGPSRVSSTPEGPDVPACPPDVTEFRRWVRAGAKPHDVRGASDCELGVFAWRELLYLTAVTATGPPKFSVWRPLDELFPADGPPLGWNDPRDYRPMQARLGPAVRDRHGRLLHYTTRWNQDVYDHVIRCGWTEGACVPEDAAFPERSMAERLAWKILEDCRDGDDACVPDDPSTFVVMGGVVPAGEGTWQEVQLGLVGLQVAHKTPRHPGWVWTSMEHVQLGPTCGEASEGTWLLDGVCRPPVQALAEDWQAVREALVGVEGHHGKLSNYRVVHVEAGEQGAAAAGIAFGSKETGERCTSCHDGPDTTDRLHLATRARDGACKTTSTCGAP